MSHQSFSRSERIAEQIARSLGKLVRLHAQDPCLKMVTITHVELSSDKKNAKVFYLPIDDEQDVDEIAEHFKKAAPHLRHELAQDVRMKYVPQIHFHFDCAQRHSEHLSGLIDKSAPDDIQNTEDDDEQA